jgi:hypothetical protein
MNAGLKPRVLPSLLIALADGRPRCDRELMEIVFSNRRVVQRRLQQLHDQKLVHIAAWAPAGESYRWRPQYKLGDGVDVPCPPPRGNNSTQRVKEFRERLTVEDKAFKDAKRRQQRRVVKRDPLVAAFFGSFSK